MLGKTVGDVVDVEAPIGTLRFEILSVERSN
jgi:transcription elongation GreA/GreB family factor